MVELWLQNHCYMCVSPSFLWSLHQPFWTVLHKHYCMSCQWLKIRCGRDFKMLMCSGESIFICHQCAWFSGGGQNFTLMYSFASYVEMRLWLFFGGYWNYLFWNFFSVIWQNWKAVEMSTVISGSGGELKIFFFLLCSWTVMVIIELLLH